MNSPQNHRGHPIRALELAAAGRARSIAALQELVRIPSLTGEEGSGQVYIAAQLRALGAEVAVEEPDLPEMFRRFPKVAQYPTHWQHDLILPYAALPTYEALRGSGLEPVLNYQGRPNVVGRPPGQRRRPIADPERAYRHRNDRAGFAMEARALRRRD